MPADLVGEIKKRKSAGEDAKLLRAEYVSKGYLESEVDRALESVSGKSKKYDENTAKLATKDFFDTVGYGFSSQQFVNIFFLQSGAGYYLIGMVNAFKTLLTVLTSTIIAGYKKSASFCKKATLVSGVLLAASLVMLAAATQSKN